MKLTLAKINLTMVSMKHYEQACAIARALDIVGDRWSLLLVRELTLGPRRYRDLATGLPGIPSNVLAARLKDLQAAAGRPAALPAGQACELRVGPEFFYLGSGAGTLTVRRGPAPDGDAVVTMPAGTFYSLLTGQMTVTGAVRHSTVDGEPEIARRALEPLAAALTKPAPSPASQPPGS